MVFRRCDAQGGRAFLVADSPCLQLTFFPPSPLPPLPAGRGENQGYFMQGAPPLASPGLSRKRHGLNLRCRCHGGGRIRAALAVSAASGSFFQKRARAVAPSIINSRKVLGVWGTLSRVPRRSPRAKKSPEPNDRADSEPQHYLLWIEVLGGLGDSFKSPPAFLPFPSFPVTASMGCQAGGSRGLRRSRRRWRRRGR